MAATAEQLKALIQAHIEDDDEKFNTISLQIAAHEAMVGHKGCATDIKNMIQNSKISNKKITRIKNLPDTLEKRQVNVDLTDIVLSNFLEEKVKRTIQEYKNQELLRKNGLKNRNKILLTGEPGTGKTMTASVIANEIHLPLYVIRLDKLVTKYMGETSVKLRQVFDSIEEFPAVYLFDEFDALGSDRSLDNDVGEMRRILNSFLQFLENEDSYSLIIAATNSPDILDKALFRRFDDVFEYMLPDRDQVSRLLRNKLEGYATSKIYSDEVFECAKGLSQSDISKACEEALKTAVLMNERVNRNILVDALMSRRQLYQYKGA